MERRLNILLVEARLKILLVGVLLKELLMEARLRIHLVEARLRKMLSKTMLGPYCLFLDALSQDDLIHYQLASLNPASNLSLLGLAFVLFLQDEAI